MAPKVLVIEDREYVRQVMVAVLVDAGYVAVGLPSAITALELLAEIRPQIVLLDMEMPGMNGREFLVRLRAMPRWAELPVLIVSAGHRAEAHQELTTVHARHLHVEQDDLR